MVIRKQAVTTVAVKTTTVRRGKMVMTRMNMTATRAHPVSTKMILILITTATTTVTGQPVLMVDIRMSAIAILSTVTISAADTRESMRNTEITAGQTGGKKTVRTEEIMVLMSRNIQGREVVTVLQTAGTARAIHTQITNTEAEQAAKDMAVEQAVKDTDANQVMDMAAKRAVKDMAGEWAMKDMEAVQAIQTAGAEEADLRAIIHILTGTVTPATAALEIPGECAGETVLIPAAVHINTQTTRQRAMSPLFFKYN